MDVEIGASRAEPAAKAKLSPRPEFSPGLPVAAVVAAWSGAAAALDEQPATSPTGDGQDDYIDFF